MKIIMYPHAGSYNRGCEAIVETTLDMLSANKKDAFLYSGDIESDEQVKLDNKVTLIAQKKDIDEKSFSGFCNRVKAKILHKNSDDLLLIKKHRFLKNKDIAISIGGDNYCYYGMTQVLSEQNKAIDLYNIPRILWGCSMDETLFSDKLISELKGYKAIFVRETVSEKILKNHGITENVYLYPDPAFTLKPKDTKFTGEKFADKKIIGINLSPLMNRFSSIETVKDNFRELISYILNETDYNIALIPHVIKSGNSDYDIEKELDKEFDSDRIELVKPDYDCGELKSLISKCDMFVGCRTHSTIAAYSTCVPTLVVGYSNKSKGIAKDIFGEGENYVVPVTELKNKEDLKNRFLEFSENSEKIREYLKEKMPSYIERSYKAGEKLKEIIKRYK